MIPACIGPPSGSVGEKFSEGPACEAERALAAMIGLDRGGDDVYVVMPLANNVEGEGSGIADI